MLGEHESAKTAVSRALSAAQRAGDLPLAAASAYLLARVLMEIGRYPHADETARKAIAALAPLAAGGRPEAISLQGALTLLRALGGRPARAPRPPPTSRSGRRGRSPCGSRQPGAVATPASAPPI
jgi:hypothetical protein